MASAEAKQNGEEKNEGEKKRNCVREGTFLCKERLATCSLLSCDISGNPLLVSYERCISYI